MLIVTMLIAWSAASVASAMLKDAMPSTYDYTTSNNTYTGASISNADMASNYSDDKPGERTLLTPQTLETPLLPDSALTNFANLLERYKPNLFEGMKLIKKRQKLKEIRKVQDGIVMLARNRNIFLKHLFNNWKENVKKVLPDVNNEALIGMLTHHFESDHALASALVQGKGEIAEKLKNMQVETWVKNEENEKGVFELLQLDKTNPFEDSIASQWVNFIEKKYNSPEEPYKVLDIVLSYFETGMNGLMGALLGALNAVGTKVVAQKLLNLQYKKWQEEKKDAANVFEILKLHKSEKPFDNRAIPAWVSYVKFLIPNDLEATNTMLSVLKLDFKDDVDRLTEKKTTPITGMNVVIQTLRKALNKRPKKRQNDFKSNEPPAKRQKEGDHDLNEPPAKRQKEGDHDLNEPPAKRQKEGDHDLNEPPAKRQKEFDFDLNEPPAKRQKEFDFDLNEALPESI